MARSQDETVGGRAMKRNTPAGDPPKILPIKLRGMLLSLCMAAGELSVDTRHVRAVRQTSACPGLRRARGSHFGSAEHIPARNVETAGPSATAVRAFVIKTYADERA